MWGSAPVSALRGVGAQLCAPAKALEPAPELPGGGDPLCYRPLAKGLGPSSAQVDGGAGQVQGLTLQTEPFVLGPTHPSQGFWSHPSPLPQPLKEGLFWKPPLGDPPSSAAP